MEAIGVVAEYPNRSCNWGVCKLIYTHHDMDIIKKMKYYIEVLHVVVPLLGSAEACSGGIDLRPYSSSAIVGGRGYLQWHSNAQVRGRILA